MSFAIIYKYSNNVSDRTVLARFHDSKDETLTMKEFREMMDKYKKAKDDRRKKSSTDDKTDKITEAFKMFDLDKDGHITKEEFGKIASKMNKRQVDAVYAKFDTNKDGKLGVEEFRKLVDRKFKLSK